MTLRYQELMKGVFVIETERFEKILAVCHPVWACDLSGFTKEQTLPPDTDIWETHRYLLFPERSACLALFELGKKYKEISKSGLIDVPAMMNAIWQQYPTYAASHNFREQMGWNDAFGLILRKAGLDVTLEVSPENLISITESIGTDYLKL